MRKKKGQKGFTLVELIVVMAIMAILAAVAVPVTVTYIQRAQNTVDTAYTADIASQAMMAVTELEQANASVTSVAVVEKVRKVYSNEMPYPIVAISTENGTSSLEVVSPVASNVWTYSKSVWSDLSAQVPDKFYAIYVKDSVLNVYFFKDGEEVTTQRVQRLLA